MSYWSGDLMRGTAENPLNAHIDFGGLEVRIKGGASTLFSYKKPQTVIQNLNIIDTNKSTDTKLAPVVNYATTGPCGYDGHTDTANYVHTEQEMKDWFASYSNAANPTKTKCLSVKIPFVTTITTQLNATDYLQSNHYDFGGATIVHSLKSLLPSADSTTPTIANLNVRATGNQLVAGIIQTFNKGTIDNCNVVFYGNLSFSTVGDAGGIAAYCSGPTATIRNSSTIFEESITTLNFNPSSAFGGIVGSSQGTIDNCRVEVPKAIGTSSNNDVSIKCTYFGGIVGYAFKSTQITNSSALLSIDNASTSIDAGGIVGLISGDGSGTARITNCYTEGDDFAARTNGGGIIGRVATSNVTVSNVRSYITYVRSKWANMPSNYAVYMGGIVGYITGSAANLSFENCYSTTQPYSNGNTWRVDGYTHQGGIVGRLDYASNQRFNKCYAYVDLMRSEASLGCRAGAFAGYTPTVALNISNSKFFIRTFINYSNSGENPHGTFIGFASTLSSSNLSNVIVGSNAWTIGTHGEWNNPVSGLTRAAMPALDSNFASADLINNPTVNYLSGSSVTQNVPSESKVSVSGKQIKFKFTGLADYYLDNIYISMNDFATNIDIGGYTQIMYNGTLLSDFNAVSKINTNPTQHNRGDSNILAQDEFYFYYKSPNTSNSNVTVKIQLKHKTTGAKRTFMLINSSQWFEL